MIKLMTLVKTPVSVDADAFRDYWRSTFFADFVAIESVDAHLMKAVHHHVLPNDIRDEEGIGNDQWAGVGTYYFNSRVGAEKVLADPAYHQLQKQCAEMLPEIVHLLVDEVWIHNRDRSQLPLKMFAFFKRLPHLSRLEALQYYQGPHATLGDEKVNKGRTVRYIQNHVLLDYQHPNPNYNFDGGPEIWFKSLDIAMDLFNDKAGMALLAEDEARFVVREDLVHFLTDEVVILERPVPG